MRRKHLRPLVAAGAVLALALAGCGGGTSSTGTPASSTEADPSGNLRVAFAGSASTFDPAKAPTPAEFAYMTPVYERLLRSSSDGSKLEGQLADSWSFAPDGSYLELKLKSGITFHDGTAFNAAAVKANIERSKTVTGTKLAPNLASVSDVVAVDDSTVRLNLVAGRGADLPASLAGYAGMMVSPKAFGGDFGLTPGDFGSGGYKVSAFKPGESVTYTRVDDYKRGDVNRAKTMTITLVASTAARTNGLRAGQYDLAQITGVDVPPAQALIKQGVFDGYARTVRVSFWLFLNTTKAPLDNQQVRQAIGYGIDREGIGNGLYQGACVPNYQPFEKSFWASSPNLENKYKLDETKAKDLVTASGVTNKTVTIEYGTQSAYEPAAQAIQSQLTKIGLDVKLAPVPQAEAFSRFNSGASQAVVTGAIPGIDPSVLVNNYFIGGANLSRAGGPAADQIKQLAAQGVDPRKSQDERAKIYQQIQEIVMDQGWFAQICSSQHLWIKTKKVQGVDETFRGLWQGLPEFGEIKMTK